MEYSKVGKYYEVFSGYAFKSQDLKETADIPIIKIGNISNGRNVINENMQFVSKELLGINKKYYVNRGDVLLSLTGSHMNQPNSVVGRSCRNYSDRLYLLNQRAGKIVPKNNASLSYIYYVLQTQAMKEMICCRAYGAANQVNVSPKSIMSIKWNFPSSDVQHSIASILSTYDTLIENNTKRIRLLEKMAENLYKEWFVRFRFPGHENVEMENGLPKGWKMTNLFDVADVTYGFAFKSNKFCDNAELNPVVRIRDIQENHTNTYTDEQCEDKYLIGKNAILIGMDGIFHMCLWNGERAYMNQRVVMLNSKEKGVCNYLLYLAIRPQIKYWEQVISGTTVAHLGDKHLRKVKVLLPEKAILEKANSIISRAMDEKNILQHQNSFLARQRDLLLPRLMSGKLEVKEELLE